MRLCNCVHKRIARVVWMWKNLVQELLNFKGPFLKFNLNLQGSREMHIEFTEQVRRNLFYVVNFCFHRDQDSYISNVHKLSLPFYDIIFLISPLLFVFIRHYNLSAWSFSILSLSNLTMLNYHWNVSAFIALRLLCQNVRDWWKFLLYFECVFMH